jgi:hypothetical protein
MKTDWTKQLASALVASELIYDDKAETCAEIADKIGFKKSFTNMKISKLVKAGKLEVVRKMVGKYSVAAYRVKK